MTTRRALLAAAAIAVGLAGWYLFRPELLFIDRHADEAPVASVDSAASPLLVGALTTGAHETRGIVTIRRVAGVGAVLRLSEFSTSNGPDVRVYLAAAPQIRSGRSSLDSGFVDLGALKGNVGDQNYLIPAGTDLTRFRTVTIWCRRFAVNFGSAVLTTPSSG